MKSIDKPICMNVRAWSKNETLKDFGDIINLEPEIVYNKGENFKLPSGKIINQLSETNYFSSESFYFDTMLELNDWLLGYAEGLQNSAEFKTSIAATDRLAVWIALFSIVDRSELSNSVIEIIKDIGFELVLEDYEITLIEGYSTTESL